MHLSTIGQPSVFSVLLVFLCALPPASLGAPQNRTNDDGMSSGVERPSNIRREALRALTQIARKAGLEVDTDVVVSVKDGITAAGVSIFPDGRPESSPDVLLAMIAGEDMRKASFYTVSASCGDESLPMMEIFDLDGGPILDPLVSTAIAELISYRSDFISCNDSDPLRSTFDDVCEILDGTPSEVCTGCWLIFTCCQKICTPNR